MRQNLLENPWKGVSRFLLGTQQWIGLYRDISLLVGSCICWRSFFSRVAETVNLSHSPIHSKPFRSWSSSYRHSGPWFSFDRDRSIFSKVTIAYWNLKINKAFFSQVTYFKKSVIIFKLFEKSIILKIYFLPYASVNYFVSFSILNSTQIKILYARCHLSLLLW